MIELELINNINSGIRQAIHNFQYKVIYAYYLFYRSTYLINVNNVRY